MKKTIGYAVLAILAIGVLSGAQERVPPRQPDAQVQAKSGEPVVQPRLYQQTWYDALLRHFNPKNIDYGRLFEERRQAFLEATVANPYFKYSLVVTCMVLLLSVALTKVWIDKRRVIWIAQECYDDVRRHDQYARQVAREAIEKYNRHMEKCNRVVEAELAGRPVGEAGASRQEAEQELRDALAKLADTERERAALATNLERTNAVVADLTMRLNGVGGPGNGRAAAGIPAAATEYKAPDLMKQISELQQQLYHERERNKRLKGM